MIARFPSTGIFKKARYILVSSALAALVVLGCLSARQPRPGSTFRDCSECPLMVVIPSGSFVMGDSLYGPPPHRVTIRSRFAVSKDLITRREYASFMSASGNGATSSRGNLDSLESMYPIVDVSWHDVREYAKWLTAKTDHHYRLLSESEYE